MRSRIVGRTSIIAIKFSLFEYSNLPGHQITAGTLIPPSDTDIFPSGKGLLLLPPE